MAPAVASAASAAARLLSAAIGPGERVATFAHTQLFGVPTRDGRRFIALTTGTASYSANSIRLAEPAFEAVRRGDRLHVTGPRELAVGGVRIAIARTWRSAVPDLAHNRNAEAGARRISTRTGESVAILHGALPGNATAPASIAALIGWGGGLTPTGDDIVCGLLAAARAYADPRLADWRAQALSRLGATTDLSAQFVRLAGDGHVTAELRELLLALGTPRLRSSLRRLIGIGHTSGADLATGVLRYLELRHLEAREGEPR